MGLIQVSNLEIFYTLFAAFIKDRIYFVKKYYFKIKKCHSTSFHSHFDWSECFVRVPSTIASRQFL